MIFADDQEVPDDLSLSVWQFLKDTVMRLNHGSFADIEIEAKFGLILDKNTNERIHLPVHSECIVAVDGWTRFASDMPVQYHRQFNERFNEEFSKRGKEKNWSYKHTKTVDKKFPSGVRLTVDPASGRTLAALRKRALSHLHIHQPGCPVDLRVSVNVEESVSGAGLDPKSASFVTERRKDRVSYLVSGGLLAVDLTQVAQYDGARSGAQVKHELEIEVKSDDLQGFLKDHRGSCQLISSCRELSRLLK